VGLYRKENSEAMSAEGSQQIQGCRPRRSSPLDLIFPLPVPVEKGIVQTLLAPTPMPVYVAKFRKLSSAFEEDMVAEPDYIPLLSLLVPEQMDSYDLY
jgi:hypothetical protein